MQKTIERPLYERASDALKVIGSIRMDLIHQNEFPIDMALDFYFGKSSKYESHMIGIEFVTYVIEEYLKNFTAKNIRTEVDIGDTRIDILADVNNVLHAYECKCKKQLIYDEKILNQMKKYRGNYKNSHILVLADTRVEDKMEKELNKNYVDIIRTDATKDDIEKRISEIQQILN